MEINSMNMHSFCLVCIQLPIVPIKSKRMKPKHCFYLSQFLDEDAALFHSAELITLCHMLPKSSSTLTQLLLFFLSGPESKEVAVPKAEVLSELS